MFRGQAQLSAVLRVVSGEAVRQICRVFRELLVHVLTENAALVDTVQHLEAQVKSQVNSAQTVYKIHPSGQTTGPRKLLKHTFHCSFLLSPQIFHLLKKLMCLDFRWPRPLTGHQPTSGQPCCARHGYPQLLRIHKEKRHQTSGSSGHHQPAAAWTNHRPEQRARPPGDGRSG